MKIRGQSHGHKARPPGEVIELPIGTPFVVANEGTTPMRFLEAVLVPTPAPLSALSR